MDQGPTDVIIIMECLLAKGPSTKYYIHECICNTEHLMAVQRLTEEESTEVDAN